MGASSVIMLQAAVTQVLSTTPPQGPVGPDGKPTFILYQPEFGGTAIYEITGIILFFPCLLHAHMWVYC